MDDKELQAALDEREVKIITRLLSTKHPPYIWQATMGTGESYTPTVVGLLLTTRTNELITTGMAVRAFLRPPLDYQIYADSDPAETHGSTMARAYDRLTLAPARFDQFLASIGMLSLRENA